MLYVSRNTQRSGVLNPVDTLQTNVSSQQKLQSIPAKATLSCIHVSIETHQNVSRLVVLLIHRPIQDGRVSLHRVLHGW